MLVAPSNEVRLLISWAFHLRENHVTFWIRFVFLCSALKQIRDHLNQGHHKKALAVLKAAMVTWPEHSMFVTQEKDEEQKEDEERYVTRQTLPISPTSPLHYEIRHSRVPLTAHRFKTWKLGHFTNNFEGFARVVVWIRGKIKANSIMVSCSIYILYTFLRWKNKTRCIEEVNFTFLLLKNWSYWHWILTV